MGGHQATLTGPALLESHVQFPGLGRTFVPGVYACSRWSLTNFFLAFSLFRQYSLEGVPMRLSMQLSLAHDISWNGVVGGPLQESFQRWAHGKLLGQDKRELSRTTEPLHGTKVHRT